MITKNIIWNVLFCQCNLTPFSWEMSDIHFVLLCNNGDVFFLNFCMLLAHIVDYKLCKIHLVLWTNKEKNTLDTTLFVKLMRNKYTHTNHDLNNPP